MSRYLYISPVGTSLLRNFVLDSEQKELIEKYSSYQPMKWFRLSPEDELNIYPDGFLCNPPRDIIDALRGFVEKDPRRASAEINGIYSIIEMYYHNPRDVEVILIGTKTCNSILCMDIIAEYLSWKGFRVEKALIKALRSVEEFEEGIIELLDEVVPRIKEQNKKGGFTYVNATPGFKPETTFLVIASILAGAASIVYIHEAFHRPVSLPIPPIKIDNEKIAEITGLYKGDECLETPIINEYLGPRTAQYYVDMGILRKTNDGTKICIRKWFEKLVEKYMQNPT